MHRSNTPLWSLAGDNTANAPSDLDYFSEFFSPFSPIAVSHLLPTHSGTADDFVGSSGDLEKRSSADPGKGSISDLGKRNSSGTKSFPADTDAAPSGEVPVEKSGQARKRKRSRTSVMHNLTERRRRDKIKEKLKTLQSLVPNSSKLDRASLLGEAVVYIKALQQQLQIFSCCGVSPAPLVQPVSLHCSQMPCFCLFQAPKLNYGMNMECAVGVPCSATSTVMSSSAPFPAASMMPSAPPSSIFHFQAPVAMNYLSSNASQTQALEDELLQSVNQAECSCLHGKGKKQESLRGTAMTQGSSFSRSCSASTS